MVRAGLPPIWFQGNVERIEPGNWVLVMSLNHQRANRDEYTSVTADTSWDMQCQHHRDHWYELFNGPLARVAAAALDTDPSLVDLRAYAGDHVILTELCPYASESFSLKPHEISDLVSY